MSQATPEVRIPPYVTETMKLVLRSPVHGVVSKTILLLTFTGHKSGKSFTTPVCYSRYGNEVHVFTHGAWWKNLRGGVPVTLRLQGHDVRGRAEPIAEDKAAVADGLMAHLRKVPSDAQYYGVAFDDDHNPRAEDVERAAQSVVMICIGLS